MKKNMGGLDRIIRIAVAAVIGVLYWQGIIEGTIAYVFIAVSVIFLLTSFVSFCPLYRIVNMNTCKVKQ